MKNLLVFCFIAFIFFTFLHSYTIEETLSQIEFLKKELAHNEQVVKEKISNLKKSNPLFADQDPFESSIKYAERLKKGQPTIDNIRKQYLDDILQKLNILRGRLFETQYVSVILGKYNPDAQIYPMKIQHLYWQKETYNIEFKIDREKANILYQNWDKVKKIGIRSIDIGDKICLAKIQFHEPISGLDITHEFQPMKSYSTANGIADFSLSPDGKYLGILSFASEHSGFKEYKNIEIIDLISERKITYAERIWDISVYDIRL